MKRQMIMWAMMMAMTLSAGAQTTDAQSGATTKAIAQTATQTRKMSKEERRQREHPLQEMKGQRRLFVNFGTSEATINGYDQETFVDMMTAREGEKWLEKKWPKKYAEEWKKDFMDDFAEELDGGVRLAVSQVREKCEYQIIVNIISCSDNGDNVVADIRIEHIESGRALAAFRYDRKRADMGDMGEELAKYIRKAM